MPTAKIVGLVTEGGERIAVSEARPPGRSYGRLFHTTFTHETAALAKKIESGSTLRVLLILPEHLNYTTFKRLDQTKLAAELHMAQSSISAAMAQLLQLGVVERQGKGPVTEWRLTTDFGWKGDVAGFHAFNRKKERSTPGQVTLSPRRKSQKAYYAN